MDVLKVVSDFSTKSFYAENEKRNSLLEERENGLKTVNEHLRGQLKGAQDALNALKDDTTEPQVEGTAQCEKLLAHIAHIEDLQ